MKELSIEDKAYDGNYKVYTELINRLEDVKNAIKKQNYGIAMDILCRPYPEFQITTSTELKESGDEKIRKAILWCISTVEHELGCKVIDGFAATELKSWLEKQGKNNMGISEDTKQKLEDNLHKALEKETPESWNEFLEKQGEQKSNANCLLSWSKIDEKMLKSLEGIVKDYWAKAEQEKNEIKIREASNVSYFLKTIQKSPLCWIKCSDGLPNRDGIYLVVTDGLYNEVYDMARYDSIEGWHKASEIIYWMPIPQLNNKSIIEQKPAEEYNITGVGSKHAEGKLGEMIKNLKPVNEVLEQKPAWSKEDEKMWLQVINEIDAIKFNSSTLFERNIAQDKIDWLKSLKERYTWKPSEEQMHYLSWIANVKLGDSIVEQEVSKHLNELLEDLKKLREK